MTISDLFAACLPGLEPLLHAELTSIGASEARVEAGGVSFRGGPETMMRANLELGLATHVLLRVTDFPAKHFAELVRKVGRVAWEDLVSRERPLIIRASARRSKLIHSKAIEERVRIGIAERLGCDVKAPDGDSSEATTVLARMVEDRCTLSIDTSGEPLHRRGYRLASGKAPLREDLARALVILSGWDRRSPLVDPMMGSGTIPIEAALLARGIPPGGLRRFAFQHAPSFDAAAFESIVAGARAASRADLPAPIFGSDRDAGAVRAATANAERAGVLSNLHLTCAALSDASSPLRALEAGGALVTNPPHGRRIGKSDALVSLHQRLGDRIRALPPTVRLAIFSSDRRLVFATGVALETAALVDQGGTKARVFVRSNSSPALTARGLS